MAKPPTPPIEALECLAELKKRMAEGVPARFWLEVRLYARQWPHSSFKIVVPESQRSGLTISTADAARILSEEHNREITTRQIRGWVDDGVLAGIRVNKRVLVSLESLVTFQPLALPAPAPSLPATPETRLQRRRG